MAADRLPPKGADEAGEDERCVSVRSAGLMHRRLVRISGSRLLVHAALVVAPRVLRAVDPDRIRADTRQDRLLARCHLGTAIVRAGIPQPIWSDIMKSNWGNFTGN